MVLIDAVVRLIPGVLGDSPQRDRRIVRARWRSRIPQVTRPRVFRDRAVPEILLSGDHAAIGRWRPKSDGDIDKLSQSNRTPAAG